MKRGYIRRKKASNVNYRAITNTPYHHGLQSYNKLFLNNLLEEIMTPEEAQTLLRKLKTMRQEREALLASLEKEGGEPNQHPTLSDEAPSGPLEINSTEFQQEHEQELILRGAIVRLEKLINMRINQLQLEGSSHTKINSKPLLDIHADEEISQPDGPIIRDLGIKKTVEQLTASTKGRTEALTLATRDIAEAIQPKAVLQKLEHAIGERQQRLESLHKNPQDLNTIEAQLAQTRHIPSKPQLTFITPQSLKREIELRETWAALGNECTRKLNSLKIERLQNAVQAQEELIALLDKRSEDLNALEARYAETTFQALEAQHTNPTDGSAPEDKLRGQLIDLKYTLETKINALRQETSLERLQKLVQHREVLLNLLDKKPVDLDDLQEKFNQTIDKTNLSQPQRTQFPDNVALQEKFDYLGYLFITKLDVLREEPILKAKKAQAEAEEKTQISKAAFGKNTEPLFGDPKLSISKVAPYSFRILLEEEPIDFRGKIANYTKPAKLI